MDSSESKEDLYKQSVFRDCAVIAYNHLRTQGNKNPYMKNMMNLAQEIILMRQKLVLEEDINPEEKQIAKKIIESKGNAYDLNTEFNKWQTQELKKEFKK